MVSCSGNFIRDVTLWYYMPTLIMWSYAKNSTTRTRTRVSLVAFAGLPFTMGDSLTCLLEEGVELFKRCIPVIDIQPMDIMDSELDTDLFTVNLLICREFETWNIAGIFNTTCAC